MLTSDVAFQSHTTCFSHDAWSDEKLGSTFWFEVSAWELKTALDCTFSLQCLLHSSFPASRPRCLGSERNLFSSLLLWGLIDSCLGSRLGGCTLLLSGNMTPRWQMLREVLTHYFEDNKRQRTLPPTIPRREHVFVASSTTGDPLIYCVHFALMVRCAKLLPTSQMAMLRWKVFQIEFLFVSIAVTLLKGWFPSWRFSKIKILFSFSCHSKPACETQKKTF